MNNEKIKVLYIAAWGRSGSTILTNTLGQVDKFFSIGELYYIWDFGLQENRLCGCGVPLRQCELWNEVLAESLGGIENINPEKMLEMRHKAYRTRHLPLMLLPGSQHIFLPRLGRHIEEIKRIYQAIQHVSGSHVIIDSSKFPSYAYILGLIPGIDLRVVHLVRDPRAIAFSWQRKKIDPGRGGKPMANVKTSKSTALWVSWNLATEMLQYKKQVHGNYLRVRYEDFATDPIETTKRILDFAGYPEKQPPFLNDNEIKLQPTHSVSGNPIRFQEGPVKIRPDMEWKKKLKWYDKMLVFLLTWPLLIKYKYLF